MPGDMKAKLTPTVGGWLLCGGFLFVHVFWPKETPARKSQANVLAGQQISANRPDKKGEPFGREGQSQIQAKNGLQTCNIVNGIPPVTAIREYWNLEIQRMCQRRILQDLAHLQFVSLKGPPPPSNKPIQRKKLSPTGFSLGCGKCLSNVAHA